ncbi:putative atp synthase subunit 5 [Phaeomoniella chlamydospora]|uniref:ATP synthase subunit 5, mitochondrial n=1 Tax=Phaeomoniella chlamydospora TaxID=158046 RepID=A0A0G2EMA6_PHACM|nr:putative atp synthase subunit 5 [Phaeomoniella chlamydospora]
MLSSKIVRPAFAAATRQSRRSAIRTYASAAAESKPPIALFGIDGTYANALYTAAAKSSTLDTTATAISSLSAIFKKDPKLAEILHAPTLSAADKSSIVAELEKHIQGGDKATVKNFLNTLAENNRLGVLEGVCEKFAQLMGAHRGEIEVTITTAAKLEPRLLSRLESAVSKSEYASGKKLKVITKVNPEIVGGLVVEIGDRTIDFSVSSKISRMNKVLTDTL